MIKPENIFDGLLVLQYRNGKKKALSLLVKRWHPKLCSHAFWYVKNKDIAKDITQDSWRIILRNIDQLKDVNSFGSWARVIVHRRAIDYIRNKRNTDKKLHQYYENSKSNYDTTENTHINTDNLDFTTTDSSETIMNGIRSLPDNQQTVLRLFYLEEYSIIEIGKILEISKGTVKSRLFYAREKLKQILKEKK